MNDRPDDRHSQAMRVAKPVLLAVVASIVLGMTLSACGGGVSADDSSTEAEVAKAEGEPTGSLTISNWPFYIAPRTIPAFEDETGVETKYVEDYNSNDEFYAKIAPSLENGDSGGRSLIAGPSPFIVERMMNNGFLQQLDPDAMPTVLKNILPEYASPAFDPDNKFAIPWQSGPMGIAVRKDLAPNIKSVCDLFEPQYHGKIELFTEMRQTLGVLMKCMGVNTDEPISEADWMAAINKVKEAKESGQLRKFAGNDWTNELLRGDVVASTGSSGDTYQISQENPNVEWVMPAEGCIIFTNYMVIPNGAPNPTAAYAFMNFVYEPENAAEITKFTHFLTPVKGVKEIVAKTDPDLANNELIFPSKEFLSNCSPEPELDPSFEEDVTAAWNAVVNS